MKRILSAILILSTLVSFGQSTTYQGTATTKVVNRGGLVMDSLIKVPTKDTLSWFGIKSDLVRKSSNGKLYFFDGAKYVELGGAGTTPTFQQVTGADSFTTHQITTAQIIVNDTASSDDIDNYAAVNVFRTITREGQDYWGFSDRTIIDGGMNLSGYAGVNSGVELRNVSGIDHVTAFQGIPQFLNASLNYTEGVAISSRMLGNSHIGQWHGMTVEFPENVTTGNTIDTSYAFRILEGAGTHVAATSTYAFYGTNAAHKYLFGGRIFAPNLNNMSGGAYKTIVIDTANGGELKEAYVSSENFANSDLLFPASIPTRMHNVNGNALGIENASDIKLATTLGNIISISDCEFSEGCYASKGINIMTVSDAYPINITSGGAANIQASTQLNLSSAADLAINSNSGGGFYLDGSLTTGSERLYVPSRSGVIALVDTIVTQTVAGAMDLVQAGYYTFNTSAGALELTLPPIAGNTGAKFTFINMAAPASVINIFTDSGGNDIWEAGVDVNTLNVDVGETVTLYNNGIKYIVLQ